MPKPKLLIVHGMGQHTEASFKGEFVNGCEWAFNLYSNYAGKSPEEYVEIIPVAYNDIFDDFRETLADRSAPAATRLQAIPDMSGALLTKAITALADFESEIDDDEFFKTHWLDVFLYRFTLLGELVRIRVGRKIADAIGTVYGGPQNVHIMAHSLGTAVVHDTLSQLYNPDYTLGDIGHLSDVMHKFGSLHLVANTSRVLESIVKPSQSVVKPGTNGCTHYYREYRHKLDPVTWPKPFDPKNNGNWISRYRWESRKYALVKPDSVTNEHGNTHNIRHYLADPLVHREIFERIFDLQLTDEQKTEGQQNYADATLSDVAEDLKDALAELEDLDLDSINGVAMAALKLKTFVEQLGGQYNA